MENGTIYFLYGGDNVFGLKNVKKIEGKEVIQIPTEQIKANPYQPRKYFAEQPLDELARSIGEYGVLQPIIVRKTGLDTYELVAGERRLRACKMAGYNSIPAIVLIVAEKDSAVIAMIENLQRENLHFIEEAKGYQSLILHHGFTQEEIAKKLGKNQSTVANKLRILRLPDAIKELILQGSLTERHARALLRLPEEEMRMKATNQILKNNSNVKEAEALIERMLNSAQYKQLAKERQKKSPDGHIDLRIFINTIKQAVNMMKDYGLPSQLTQIDNEDNIELIVRIPKM